MGAVVLPSCFFARFNPSSAWGKGKADARHRGSTKQQLPLEHPGPKWEI